MTDFILALKAILSHLALRIIVAILDTFCRSMAEPQL